MGLDTYAARSQGDCLTEADLEAFERAEVELCGGLFSGEAGSFRGKVYSNLVHSVTGESLYQLWIPPETVNAMADAFARCDPEQVAEAERDVPELRKFFAVCAERGLGLRGWW